MKKTILTLIALATFAAAATASAAPASECSVSIASEPLVMRLGKDEFRIAFGINGEGCPASGCSGYITYKASWKTEEGTTHTDRKLLGYAVHGGSQRSIAVDRHYFDTAEGRHTTDVVDVSVESVSCSNAIAMR